MRRRAFISLLGGAAATWPVAVQAQRDRMRRIGVLTALPPDDPDSKERFTAFRQGLETHGWSEGGNVQIDIRFASAAAQAQMLAKELVALNPDVMVAVGATYTVALRQESRAIPIVFVGIADPIGEGFIASLARPGGNLTGLMSYEASVAGKWIAMLKEIAPQLTRAAYIANPRASNFADYLREAEAMASSLQLKLVPSPVENAGAIERAIEMIAREPDSGLVLPPSTTTTTHRDLIIALAARHRLPAVYGRRVFVAAGGLMSYGTDDIDLFRQAASYIDRILSGTKPADLPVQAPTKYETVLNLKTAKALGLTVPPSLLVAADEVIE